MEAKETIIQKLGAAGWQNIPLAGMTAIDVRMVLKTGDNHLAIDNRCETSELWLWLIKGTDRNCLGITYGDKLEQILDQIIRMQNDLKYEDYLSNYFALQPHCDVQIMCWEQFSDSYAESL